LGRQAPDGDSPQHNDGQVYCTLQLNARVDSYQVLVAEVTDAFKIPRDKLTKVVQVWEDNEGCLILANMKPAPQLTPHCKHYFIKNHWFKEQLVPGEIKIKKIYTLQQKADLGTKCLTKQKFLELRLMVCGW
jgi:hypothetical protein